MTLEELIEPYVGEQLRLHHFVAGTARNNRVALRHFVGVAAGRALDRALILEYLGTLADLAPGTRRSRFSSVRTWCRWLLEHGFLDHDPTAGVRAPKVPRYQPRALVTAEVLALIASGPDARARAILGVMYEEGLRCCEVARLELADYDRARRTLYVVGKGDKSRVVHVSDLCDQLIREYLAEVPATWGPLFRSKNQPTQPLTAGAIGKLVSQWMKDAGMKKRPRDGVSAHALRHTSASDLLEASGDIVAVQEFLGHAWLNTTQTYLRNAGIDRIRSAMAARAAATVPAADPAAA